MMENIIEATIQGLAFGVMDVLGSRLLCLEF